MPKTVSLSELLVALQFSDPTSVMYLDRTTAQIAPPTQGRDETNGPKEPVAASGPDRFERLPILTEQDEIELARQFSATAENAEDRQRLSLALSSTNPHEAFQTSLFRCRIANEWFQFRDEYLLRLGKDWLETHGIPYNDDVTREAD
jgi:hypothetical protein